MSKTDSLRLMDYLEHIVVAIERIQTYVEDMDEVEFLADVKTQDAVVRNFEIIGEAARNIMRYHTAFADARQNVPWQVMVSLRNRVAHGYFTVDFDLLWRTTHEDLPELHREVRSLLDDLSGKE